MYSSFGHSMSSMSAYLKDGCVHHRIIRLGTAFRTCFVIEPRCG
jgi:hypothetical protein